MSYLQTVKNLISSSDPKYTLSTRTSFYCIINTPFTFGTVTGADWIFSISEVSVPNISTNSDFNTIRNERGTYTFPNKTGLTPESNQVKVSFRETANPIIERLFYNWHISNASIKSRLIKSIIDIVVLDDNFFVESLRYRINGAFPIFIDMPELNHIDKTLKFRSVIFAFDEIILDKNKTDDLYELYKNKRKEGNQVKKAPHYIIKQFSPKSIQEEYRNVQF